jgi:hypothetical protein
MKKGAQAPFFIFDSRDAGLPPSRLRRATSLKWEAIEFAMLRIGVEKDESASPLVALARAKRADSIASHLREVARA